MALCKKGVGTRPVALFIIMFPLYAIISGAENNQLCMFMGNLVSAGSSSRTRASVLMKQV